MKKNENISIKEFTEKEKKIIVKDIKTVFVICLIIIFFEILTILFISSIYRRMNEVGFEASTLIVEEDAYVDVNSTPNFNLVKNQKTELKSKKIIDTDILGFPFKFSLKDSEGLNGILINIKVSSGTLFVYDPVTTRIIDVGQSYNCLNGTTIYYSLCDNFEDELYISDSSIIEVTEIGNEEKTSSLIEVSKENNVYYAVLVK